MVKEPRAIRIAIVGSRNYPDLDAVRDYVRGLPSGTTIVSGGARGVDREAVSEARRRGDLFWREYLPDWGLYGRRAGAIRNQRIVDNADRVVAFWDGRSKGTAITIEMARKAAKPIEIRQPEELRK